MSRSPARSLITRACCRIPAARSFLLAAFMFRPASKNTKTDQTWWSVGCTTRSALP
jgi:hypothetical protein